MQPSRCGLTAASWATALGSGGLTGFFAAGVFTGGFGGPIGAIFGLVLGALLAPLASLMTLALARPVALLGWVPVVCVVFVTPLAALYGPLVLLGVAAAVFLLSFALICALPHPAAAAHTCRRCGYSLEGLDSGVCPECGAQRGFDLPRANRRRWRATGAIGGVLVIGFAALALPYIRVQWAVLPVQPKVLAQIQTLEERLLSNDIEVLWPARRDLHSRGAEHALRLYHTSTHPRHRAAAIDTLGWRKDRAFADLFVGALADPDEEVRISAIGALEGLGVCDFADAIRPLTMAHGSARVASRAREALARCAATAP